MHDVNSDVQSPGENSLLDTIQALRSMVENLRERRDELEEERDELLEENRALRREITQSRLIADLKASTAVLEDGAAPAIASRSTEHLYHTLPSTFTYAEFFQIAENTGLGLDKARAALRTFLANDLVVQEGSRLKKDRVGTPAEDRDAAPFSRLAA